MTNSAHNPFFSILPSPVGHLTLVADNGGLTWIAIERQRFTPDLSNAENAPSHPVLQQTAHWLGEYFDGKRPDANLLPLHPEGTPFRQTIWHLLLTIPYGTTVTYGDIAREYLLQNHTRQATGIAHYAQAVGNAVGHNPISIVIPCHRVIGANGSLVGYGGGLDIKQRLLDFERHAPAELRL